MRGNIHLFEKVDGAIVKRARKQLQPQFVRDLFQFRLPLPGRKCLLVEVVKSAAIPQRAARNPKTFSVAAQRDRVGRVGLELKRIRASVLGGSKNPDRLIKVLAMIRRQLGHNVNWTIASDLPVCELEGPRTLCFEQN